MSFATDYLAQIERIAERMPLPRVTAVAVAAGLVRT